MTLIDKRREMPIEVAADRLETVPWDFLRLRKEICVRRFIKPKHHWQLDVPDQLQRHCLVLDTFVIERTHLSVKAIAEHITNTSVYERPVMLSIVTEQLRCGRQGDPVVGFGLIGRVAPRPQYYCVSADKLATWTIEVSCKDIVTHGSVCPGIVVACAQRSDDILCCSVTPLL